MNIILSWWCRIFLHPIIKRLFIKKVAGIENMPKGNFILCSNHTSYLDEIALGYICIPRKFRFIGQTDGHKGIFKLVLYAVYSLAGVIQLNRNDSESKKEVLERAVDYLKKGDIIIIYPEGTRSRIGQIGKGKWGVAKLFLQTGLPIVPVGIKGAFKLLPPGGKLKIERAIEINIGSPLVFPKEMSQAGQSEETEQYKKILQDITNKTMKEIAKLCQ